MNNKIETEKKYYCVNNRDLYEKISILGYKLVNEGYECDEYFTDINSEYIKKRTCLRIRKKDNDTILTFKGESKDFDSSFTKLNLSFDILSNNYDNLIKLFSMMGYYSYTIVNKKRYTYQKKEGSYIYNIMIDTIEDLGDFIEFEISSNKKFVDEDILREKLNQFVSKFSDLCYEEAMLPYRDFVAIKEYNEILPSKDILGVHINLDEFLKEYEKEFYTYYKSIMKEEFNASLKWKEFKENIYNSMINPELEHKLNNYFDNLIIQDSMLMVLFTLLKQIKDMELKIILSTNANEIFINSLLYRISNNTIDEIVYLNNSKAIYSVLSKNNIDIKNYFNISESTLKDTNSLLLIIINNYKID